MALSTKVHKKAKMIKSDRWESWGDSCPSNWVGDGACDDECNTEDNSWDGGDCCGPDVDDWWCWDCECLDPNSEDFVAEGDEDEEEDPCTFWYVGDGYCDDECNVENHDFDGGDCCGDDVETWFCTECACLE